jgi:hypothetical protein
VASVLVIRKSPWFVSLAGPKAQSVEFTAIVEGLTAVIVEIFTGRLSRRLMVVLVAGRVVLTYDDISYPYRYATNLMTLIVAAGLFDRDVPAPVRFGSRAEILSRSKSGLHYLR